MKRSRWRSSLRLGSTPRTHGGERRALSGGPSDQLPHPARQIVASTDDAIASNSGGTAEEVLAYRRTMVLRISAIAHWLRMQLRGTDEWEVIRPLIPAEEFGALSSAVNRTTFCFNARAYESKTLSERASLASLIRFLSNRTWIDSCSVMEAPRQVGAVYGEEYRAADASSVVRTVKHGESIPAPPTYQRERLGRPLHESPTSNVEPTTLRDLRFTSKSARACSADCLGAHRRTVAFCLTGCTPVIPATMPWEIRPLGRGDPA
jgi:hypothetical protein